ncbi:MAG: DUF2812 domain-containing protein [Clostridiales bacterium]|nr:DUF2812 domain-containing protein [Clostridiales bacterium]
MSKKRTFAFYQVYENDALKAYLEDMALKGWKLVKIGSLLLTFESCEPHPIRYCVEVMEKASAYASNQTLPLKRYREFCQDAGWSYLGTNGFLHVFYTEDMNAVPVETDHEERYERICRACNGTVWQTVILFMLLSAMNLYSAWQKGSLLNSQGVSILLLMTAALWYAGGFLRWRHRAKRTLRENHTLPVLNYRTIRRVNYLFTGGILLFCIAIWGSAMIGSSSNALYVMLIYLAVFALLMLFFSVLIHWLREKKTFSRRTNILIYWGIGLFLILLITLGGGYLLLRSMQLRY